MNANNMSDEFSPTSSDRSGHQRSSNVNALHGLKVVIMLGCLEIGGAEKQALLFARWLKSHGVSVEVWGLSHAGALTDHCDTLGIPWHVSGNPLAEGIRSTVMRLLELAWRLRKAKVDLLIPYTLVPNVACGIVWRLAGARLCIWNQRDEGVEGHRKPFESWAIRMTPFFVANSRAGADFLARDLRVNPAKIGIVPNGVALDPPAESRISWRRRLGLLEDSICVGMVANLSSKKDHATLLMAWRQVIDSSHANHGKLKLVLAGRHDDAAACLFELVLMLDLTDSVMFLGPVSDVAGFLQAVDIGVYSSVSEGLPNGVLECMSMGKVMVATDIPGIRAAVGDEYALLCPPGDSTAMATQLLSVIGDSELAGRIAEQNMARAATCFGIETMCRRMAQIMTTHDRLVQR